MNFEDQHFETFLQQFQPELPQPLPDFSTPEATPGNARVRTWTSRAGVAALIALSCAAGIRFRSAHPLADAPVFVTRTIQSDDDAVTSAMRMGAQTRLWLRNEREWDRALLAASPKVLPDVERPGTALAVLAK